MFIVSSSILISSIIIDDTMFIIMHSASSDPGEDRQRGDRCGREIERADEDGPLILIY